MSENRPSQTSDLPARSVTVVRSGPTTTALDPHLPNVPGYAVSREIASGGMAVVYAAHDPAFDREVAVKVMRPGHDAMQFVVESKVTAQLPHPGVPPVYALGQLPDGRPFLVMKLISGRTLGNVIGSLRRAGAPDSEFLGTFEQICQTVGFAHASGIVHRDLKPSNVMVGAFGEVLVMDWGLAKQVAHAAPGADAGPLVLPSTAATVAGQVKGTPAYMAPEQAQGKPVDARADVFALGGILAALLTGAPPFVGETVLATVIKAAQAELDECFEQLDECEGDGELVAIAKKCLAPHPDDRYANGEEVAQAVAAHRAAVEERLRLSERERVRRAVEVRELRKRRKVQLALAGAVVLLAVGGGAFAWYSERQASTRKAAAFEQQLKDERAAAEARARGQQNATAIAILAEQCEQHLKGDEPDKAAAVLAEIDRRPREGVEGALAERVKRCRDDLALLRELDRLEDLMWSVEVDNPRSLSETNARWDEALTRLRLDPTTTPPEQVVRRIRGSLIESRIVGALDTRMTWDKSGAVLAVLLKVDPDPFRSAMREAIQKRDAKGWIALLNDPAALRQPLEFAARLGRLPGAPERRVEILLAAHRERPGDYGVAMSLGALFPPGRNLFGAQRVRWFQAALAARPTNFVAWSNLGDSLNRSGDVNGAIETYRAALRIHPKIPSLHSNLGAVLCEKQDWDGAIAACEAALQLDPNFATAYDGLGLALRGKGRFAEALAAAQKAVELNPQNIICQFGLGGALLDAGELDRAEAVFNAVIRRDPKFAAAHNNLGILFAKRSDLDAAIKSFQEACRLEPNNPDYQGNLKKAQLGRALTPKKP